MAHVSLDRWLVREGPSTRIVRNFTVDTRTLGPQRGPAARLGGSGARGNLAAADRGSRRGVSRAVFKFSVRGPATPRGYLINLERSKVRLVLELLLSPE